MTKPTQLSQPNQLGKLLMLASSNLPIGSYTYSQGLESAIVSGDVSDEASVLRWIDDYVQFALLGNELPMMAVILCLLEADKLASDVAKANIAKNNNPKAGEHHHPKSYSAYGQQLAMQVGKYHLASRETAEFERESTQMAHAFGAWIESVLGLDVPKTLQHQGFLPLFAHICHHEGLRPADTLLTYGFGQLENLVLASVKSVPLGQMAGGRLLWQLQGELEASIEPLLARVQGEVDATLQSLYQVDSLNEQHRHESHLKENHLQEKHLQTEALRLVSRVCTANNLPNLAIRSSQHERQYSRLYRS